MSPNTTEYDALAAYETKHPGGVPTVSHCSSCGAHIWWGYTAKDKRCPYVFDVGTQTFTSTSHFTNCPQAQQHSRRR